MVFLIEKERTFFLYIKPLIKNGVIELKPTVFNKSIEEIKEFILENIEYIDLNDAEQFRCFEMRFSPHFKSSKCFVKFDHYNEKEILLCMDPKYYTDNTLYNIFTTDCIVFGKIIFKGDLITDDLDIEIFDSKDIKGFERVRLRLLFED